DRQDNGLRFRTCPAESGTSVNATPPDGKGLRSRIGRAGPGFGPGAAKSAEPRISVHGLPGGTRASARDPAGSVVKGFGRRRRQGRKTNFGSKFAKRRTARASALSGSQRGNLQPRFGAVARTP